MRVAASFGSDEDLIAWWMISHSQAKRGQESPLGVSFIMIIIPLGRTLACEMLHL